LGAGILARRVVLLIESSRKVGRDVLSGIASYAAEFGPWHFCHYERSLEDPPPRWLRKWKPDGIIARIENRRVLRRIASLGAPTIDVIYSLQPPVEGTVRVVLDQRAIAVTAADHLRGQGFEQFAFCGYPGILWSDIRQRLFVEHLRESRRRVFEYQKPSGRRQNFETRVELDELWHTEALMRWIRSLPRPIGMMACNDVRARQILTACLEAGIAVPDEIGVLGVDNDELVCTFCNPPLSSVDQDVRRVGYEAAVMLDKLMSGKSCPQDVLLTSPVNVRCRMSTDAVVVADPELRDIVRYIREHACEGLKFEQLVEHTALSRSTLQRWFAREFHHSATEEIDRVRLERIKELMATTDLPLREIGYRSGFEHFESMHRFFKARVGITPSEYRDTLRIGGGGAKGRNSDHR
jgi:LacI family transcriptional regulator